MILRLTPHRRPLGLGGLFGPSWGPLGGLLGPLGDLLGASSDRCESFLKLGTRYFFSEPLIHARLLDFELDTVFRFSPHWKTRHDESETKLNP